MNPFFITGDWHITAMRDANSKFNLSVILMEDGRVEGDVVGNYVLKGSQFLLFGTSAGTDPIYFYGLLNAGGSLEGISVRFATAQVPFSWKGVKGAHEDPANFNIQDILNNREFRDQGNCCDSVCSPTIVFDPPTGNGGYRDVTIDSKLMGVRYPFKGAYLAAKLLDSYEASTNVPTLVLFQFASNGETLFYGGIIHEYDDSYKVRVEGIRVHKSLETHQLNSIAHFELMERD